MKTSEYEKGNSGKLAGSFGRDACSEVDSSAYLTKQQVACYLNVSVRTVDSLMRARKLPFIKLTRKLVRFRREDVDGHLQRNFRVNAIGG